MIHINTLRDDYYVFDKDAYELRGDMTRKVSSVLGQKVRVRVADADKMLKTVDFTVVHGCRKTEKGSAKWQKKQG